MNQKPQRDDDHDNDDRGRARIAPQGGGEAVRVGVALVIEVSPYSAASR